MYPSNLSGACNLNYLQDIYAVSIIITPPSVEKRNIVTSMPVGLFVLEHISATTRPNSTKFYVHVVCGCGSVFLWHHSEMLCTSGFTGDVMFARNKRREKGIYSN